MLKAKTIEAVRERERERELHFSKIKYGVFSLCRFSIDSNKPIER